MNNIPSSSFFKKAQEVNQATQIAKTIKKKKKNKVVEKSDEQITTT